MLVLISNQSVPGNLPLKTLKSKSEILYTENWVGVDFFKAFVDCIKVYKAVGTVQTISYCIGRGRE
jgi:hypothetical protein